MYEHSDGVAKDMKKAIHFCASRVKKTQDMRKYLKQQLRVTSMRVTWLQQTLHYHRNEKHQLLIREGRSIPFQLSQMGCSMWKIRCIIIRYEEFPFPILASHIYFHLCHEWCSKLETHANPIKAQARLRD